MFRRSIAASLLFLLPLLTVGALAQTPAVADAAPEGWRVCAQEGQACRVQGRAIVRYGEPGRWVTRSVVGTVDCDNEAFGDPAPNVPKRCEARGGAAEGWTFCAAEGETCQFRGQSQVRFGTDRQFVTRSGYGTVRCDAADFGDPAPGVTKYCEVRSSEALNNGGNRPNAWKGMGPPVPNMGWRYCAAEGESCRVQGRAQVRFGDGRRYNTRSVNGEIACSVQAFGDPAFRVLKHCEVQAAALPPPTAPAWAACAAEGERCDFNGNAQVRYGTAGRYVYRDASNGVRCDTRSFGSDPYEGRVKGCEIRR